MGGKPCDRLHLPKASKQDVTAVKPGTGLGWEEGKAGVAAVRKWGEGERSEPVGGCGRWVVLVQDK